MRSVFSLSNITSEFRRSSKLALPLIASEVILALSGFIATVMVAHLGTVELAANSLVWKIYLTVILFFIGILYAISIMIAQSFGASDNKGISICFKQGLIMSILFSLPMMLMMWFAPTILVWTKQDPEVIRLATPLFHSIMWSMLPMNITIVIEQFLIGITKTRLVLMMSILLVPIEILFYYIFLFGECGMPVMGLAGIGYALTISYCIASTFFISYLYFSKRLKIYDLFKKWWVIERKFFLEIVRFGLPIGLMWCSELAFFAVVALMMGVFGVTVLAAYEIAHQYLIIALVVIFALSQSTAIRVGFEAGRNDRDKLQLTAVVNMMIGFSLISIFSFFYIFFPQAAIGLDIDIYSEAYKDVTTIALKFFPLIPIILAVDCVRIISNGALRGLKDTNVQLLISALGFWLIAFPTTYLLSFKLGFGGVGIWWGIIFSMFIIAIILLIRFNKLSKTINMAALVTKK